jgi:hypothetical protein
VKTSKERVQGFNIWSDTSVRISMHMPIVTGFTIQWRKFSVMGLTAPCESDVRETKIAMIMFSFK